MQMKQIRLLTLGLALGLAACTGDDDTGGDDTTTPPKETDCSIETSIDATSADDWIYFDLETQAEVTVANPDDSTEWDLAFQRFKVKSNGGISGTGGVEVAMVEGTGCNELLKAPNTGYRIDAVDGEDDGDIEDYAISFGISSETGPWGYDAMTHRLFDSKAVWVVKSVEGNYFKLSFIEYYGTSGDAAELTFMWKAVDEPENLEVLPPGAIKVETSLMGKTYLSFDDGVITTTNDNTDWDVAVSGPAWQTNGGLMRMGVGGARIADETDFDAVTSAPTLGYMVDADIPYPGPPGAGRYDGNPILVDWFDYNSVDHTVEPRDLVYLIRGGDGSYGKLKILDYSEVTLDYVLKIAPVDRAVETRAISVDSDAAAFTYVNLRTGEIVEPDTPDTDRTWDISFSGTRIQTNSGTSGNGDGGGSGPISMALSEITDAPASFDVDEMLDDPENPGSMISANPALMNWYETTTGTAAVDAAFVVRTADGGYAKLKISGWTDGNFDLDIAYAGPSQDTF